MRLALFGGTFDPLHYGHLLMAEAARASYHLDRVVFIPTGLPPHKTAPEASALHRLAMVRLAARSNPFFRVSDWEIRQKRTVYTFETLAHFHQQAPRQALFFIVGSDMLKELDTWRGGRSLLQQCTFLVVERPGTSWFSLSPSLRRKVKRVPVPAVAFASHQIRQSVRKNRSIRYQVPDRVERYIRQHHLYR